MAIYALKHSFSLSISQKKIGQYNIKYSLFSPMHFTGFIGGQQPLLAAGRT